MSDTGVTSNTLDPLSNNLLAVNNTAPHIDAGTQFSIAQSAPDPQTASQTAGGIAGFQKSLQLKQSLEALNPKSALSTYKGLSDDDKSTLNQLGYQAPEAQKSHSNGAGHYVGDLLHWGWQPFHAASYTAKKALSIANVPANYVRAGITTVGQMLPQVTGAAGNALNAGTPTINPVSGTTSLGQNAQNTPVPVSPSQDHGAGNPLSVSDWWKTFMDSRNPNRNFDPRIVNYYNDNLGTKETKAAMDVAAGTAPEQLAGKLKDPIKQQDFMALVNSDKFQEAVENLHSSNQTPFEILSGPNYRKQSGGEIASAIGDTTLSFVYDPVSHVAGAITAAKEAKYALGETNTLFRAYDEQPTVQRFFKQASDAYNQGGYAAAIARFPKQLTPYSKVLADAKPSTPEQFVKALTDAGDASRLAAGQPIVDMIGQQIPHTSAFKSILIDAKQNTRNTIDLLKDTRFHKALDEATEETAKAGALVDPATGQITPMAQAALSRAQEMRMPLKERVGQTLHSITTLTSRGVDVNDAKSAVDLGNGLSKYLPQPIVDGVMNAWVDAPDVAVKKNIFMGSISSMLRNAGWEDKDTQSFMDRLAPVLQGTLDENTDIRSVVNGLKEGQAYGPGGKSLVQTTTGETADVGYLRKHMTTHWDLPDFKQLYAGAQKTLLAKGYDATFNNDIYDKLIQQAWKPYSLMRLGFPVRIGLEENLNSIMREGIGPWIESQAANAGLRNIDKSEALAAKADSVSASTLDRFLSDIPEEQRASITSRIASGDLNPDELVGHSLGWHTYNSLSAIHKKLGQGELSLAPQDLIDYITNSQQHGGFDSYAYRRVSNGHKAGGYEEANPNLNGAVKKGFLRYDYKKYVPEGYSGDVDITSPFFAQNYRDLIKDHFEDPQANYVIQHLGDSKDSVVNELANQYEQDPQLMAMAYRSKVDSGGRVAGIDTDQRSVLEDWANTTYESTKYLFTGRDGKLLDDIHGPLASSGYVPTTADILGMDAAKLPASVSGLTYEVHHSNIFAAISNGFFNQIAEPIIEDYSRRPQFVEAGYKAFNNYKDAGMLDHLVQAGMRPEDAEATLYKLSWKKAADGVVPYIHDPSVRSEAAIIMRNMSPFYFAQEQYYKRWLRTLSVNPQAFRQAQLTIQGLEHVGFVHKDDQGNDFFYYPGGSVVQKLLSNTLGKVLGGQPSLPVPVSWTGQLSNIIPGVSEATGEGGLSLGPGANIALHFLSNRFPELQEPYTEVTGQAGASQNYWHQVVPGPIAKIVDVFNGRNPDAAPQLGSAMLSGLQWAKASDLDHTTGTQPDGSPIYKKGYKPLIPGQDDAAGWEKFNAQLKNWGRVVLASRYLYAQVTPASPSLKIDYKGIDGGLRDLMSKMPADEAIRLYLTSHPDADPYSVFASKSAGGGNLPATKSTLSFMNKNESFLKSYPMAASYIIPQTSKDKQYSPAAYREQLATGLRQKKTWSEISNDIYYSDAAQTFYSNKDDYDAQTAGLKGAAKSQAQQKWSSWQQEFFNSHPVFAADYQSGAGTQQRVLVLAQVQQALRDPNLPKTAETKGLRTLLENYDNFKSQLNTVPTTASGARRAMNDQFSSWIASYVVAHPEVENFYNRAIRPDIGTAQVQDSEVVAGSARVGSVGR